MDFLPRRRQLLPCVGFYPVSGSICSQTYYLQGSLPSVCTAISLHLPSYLFCLVSSSSPVICNYTVVQSSTVYTVIQITFFHTFVTSIHSYIDTFTYSYTSYTSHHSHMITLVIQNLVLVMYLQFGLYLSLCQAPSFYKRTS